MLRRSTFSACVYACLGLGLAALPLACGKKDAPAAPKKDASDDCGSDDGEESASKSSKSSKTKTDKKKSSSSELWLADADADADGGDTATGTKTGTKTSTSGDAKVTYESKIKALLKTNCAECHSKDAESGKKQDPMLDTWDGVKAKKDKVASKVADDSMPPSDHLEADDKKAFDDWKKGGYLEKEEAASSDSDGDGSADDDGDKTSKKTDKKTSKKTSSDDDECSAPSSEKSEKTDKKTSKKTSTKTDKDTDAEEE